METVNLLPGLSLPPAPWYERLLSRVLWLANSDPPCVGKQEFYRIKERLLTLYGHRVGHDWQMIEKVCYGCTRTGRHVYPDGSSGLCRRCGGTGLWDCFWVRLERWEFGGRIFHRPAERTWRKPVESVRIVGRIRHADVGMAGHEAVLWLALLFDRALFYRLMRASRRYNTFPYPLSTLQQITFRLWMFFRGFERRKCSHCGGTFRQWFRDRRSHVCVCYRCQRIKPEYEDIPFWRFFANWRNVR